LQDAFLDVWQEGALCGGVEGIKVGRVDTTQG
jgi:Leu/Phe-tRNA-protein transferase